MLAQDSCNVVWHKIIGTHVRFHEKNYMIFPFFPIFRSKKQYSTLGNFSNKKWSQRPEGRVPSAFPMLEYRRSWSIEAQKRLIKKSSKNLKRTCPIFHWHICWTKKASTTKIKRVQSSPPYMTLILTTYIGKKLTRPMAHFIYMGPT